MRAAIAWMPGHGSRPGGWDPGATSPSGWTEAELVRQIVAAAWLACEARHVPAEIVAAGSYRQRGQDADAGVGAELVIQVHADASFTERTNDRAAIYYWPGNPAGEEAARRLAAALGRVVPWPVSVRAADDSWPGPRACLASVAATSVLVEVGFTDGLVGAVQLPALAKEIGAALGAAV